MGAAELEFYFLKLSLLNNVSNGAENEFEDRLNNCLATLCFFCNSA
jgi:hypothetical protein